jgi:hypothetical protein
MLDLRALSSTRETLARAQQARQKLERMLAD